MRPRLRVFMLLAVLAGVAGLAAIAIGGWWYLNREQLARQWACYRVGAAGSFEQARAELAWFEHGPDRDARLGELVRKWGTGNQRFDLYLARYVDHPASSQALRETFSEELGRRRELLPRWAHYWSYRTPLEPDREVASIIAYFDTLASAERPLEPITWREVLNLQAVLQWSGQGRLARGLSPTNWRRRYRRWQETSPSQLPPIARPAKPFPDWRGPAAEQ